MMYGPLTKELFCGFPNKHWVISPFFSILSALSTATDAFIFMEPANPINTGARSTELPRMNRKYCIEYPCTFDHMKSSINR